MGLAFLVCLTLPAQAGIVHGIVLEQATSRPLARTEVRLLRVGSSGDAAPIARATTNLAGQYWFPSLPNGVYMISSSRLGFQTAVYGQKRPTGPGMPILVEGESNLFAEIKMFRLGGITGKVVDENFVGLPSVNVVAYRTTLPLRIAAQTKSDDRGVYRIGGLPAGKYWVRSSPLELEDGSSMHPTFAPGTTRSTDARVLDVTLDNDVPEVNFQPRPGRLFSVSGVVSGCPKDAKMVRVTLSSDTGRKETTAGCEAAYSFNQLSPGRYEILAEPMGVPVTAAAWVELDLDHEVGVGLHMVDLPTVQFTARIGDTTVYMMQDLGQQVELRRRDLAGVTEIRKLSRTLLPGNWEVFVRPTANLGFVSFGASPFSADRSRRMPEAADAPILSLRDGARAAVELGLSKTPARIGGFVQHEGRPAIGAPVYLLATSPAVRQRVHGLLEVQSDHEGRFAFQGLPAGDYRILCTVDLDEINEQTLDHARAQTVTVTNGATKTVTLPLYEVR
ncbi:MAG: carboxypeptidase-like regulatory domain-containing protein [Bryobacteraceae bacterium]